MNQSECWHCGDARHATNEHYRKSDPSALAKTVATSLKGAELGRRAGWRTCQSKAAELVLTECSNAEEGLRIYKMVMSLEDK